MEKGGPSGERGSGEEAVGEEEATTATGLQSTSSSSRRDAWAKVKDTPAAVAAQRYVALATEVVPGGGGDDDDASARAGGGGPRLGPVFSTPAVVDGGSDDALVRVIEREKKWRCVDGGWERARVFSQTPLYHQPPLHTAAADDDATTITSLLTSGADPSARDPDGATALHFAADAGALSALSALLTGGAPVDALDADGATPLHYAALAGRRDAAAALVAAGADAGAVDGDGVSARGKAPPGWGEWGGE